jgi:transcriptional regulator with XRE-family HTH domain
VAQKFLLTKHRQIVYNSTLNLVNRLAPAAMLVALDPACDFGPELAANLRRLMARCGITLDALATASGVDRRTIAAVLRGKNRPHSRTLHRLAQALGASADEFFQDRAVRAHRAFDRETNPLVAEVIAQHPELFAGWTEADFDELYSRFGTGGALTRAGAAAAAGRMNRTRAVHEKVALVLETHEADLLEQFVDLLYRRVAVGTAPSEPNEAGEFFPANHIKREINQPNAHSRNAATRNPEAT